MSYRICPYCGAHLDPDEKCDCEEKEDEERCHKRAVYKEPGTDIEAYQSRCGESGTGR